MMDFVQGYKNTNQHLKLDNQAEVTLYLKREDQIHPYISGNKYRKLKYNLIEARRQGFDTLLTFGGAFSNHIAAVASAGLEMEFKTIGVIRGEELEGKISDNTTLAFAQSCGMKFHFASRADYREKATIPFINRLKDLFGSFFLIPEGGTNSLAVKGCEEILIESDKDFDYICCSVGTGGTVSGIINSARNTQKILGFPALKGDFLKEDICKFAQPFNWELISDYHFGGYAKINSNLVAFINQFKAVYQIQLDPIYTGKMMYGLFDMIEKGYFPRASKILAVHTGGLQGISGMNALLKKKGLPLIK